MLVCACVCACARGRVCACVRVRVTRRASVYGVRMHVRVCMFVSEFVIVIRETTKYSFSDSDRGLESTRTVTRG